MANTRQLRLNDISKIQERAKEFADKRISLVFHDDRVITGTVHAVTTTDITLLNMRNKRMTFRFLDIAELYFDTVE
ncbi:MAG TPA: hypothetical protein VGD65_02650 [Chryseosolibacter sp.]